MHDGLTRQADQFVGRHEMESRRSQFLDQPGQDHHRRLAVAAAVVHQDDLVMAVNHFMLDAADGPFRADPAEVAGFHVHATDHIAEPCCHLDHLRPRVHVSEMKAGVRQSKQVRLKAGCRLQNALRCVQFHLEPVRIDGESVRMRKRMAADIVTFRVHPADQIRRIQNVASDQIERRVYALLFQDVEDPAGKSRIRPVVEGQRDRLRIRRPPNSKFSAQRR